MWGGGWGEPHKTLTWVWKLLIYLEGEGHFGLPGYLINSTLESTQGYIQDRKSFYIDRQHPTGKKHHTPLGLHLYSKVKAGFPGQPSTIHWEKVPRVQRVIEKDKYTSESVIFLYDFVICFPRLLWLVNNGKKNWYFLDNSR